MTLPLSAGAPRGQGDFLLLHTKKPRRDFFFVSPRETVEKLRFSDNLCFDFAKHGRPKVPIRKLSPS